MLNTVGNPIANLNMTTAPSIHTYPSSYLHHVTFENQPSHKYYVYFQFAYQGARSSVRTQGPLWIQE